MTYTNDDQTVILQVVLGQEADDATVAHWRERFDRWYDPAQARIEYPVSCDSHAYDVFADEFGDTWVDFAAVVLLPYGPDAFAPFTEESAGVELAQWTEATQWVDNK